MTGAERISFAPDTGAKFLSVCLPVTQLRSTITFDGFAKPHQLFSMGLRTRNTGQACQRTNRLTTSGKYNWFLCKFQVSLSFFSSWENFKHGTMSSGLQGPYFCTRIYLVLAPCATFHRQKTSCYKRRSHVKTPKTTMAKSYSQISH